ncbi:MAG: hypothetical protein ACI854_001650 [Arenicella sp.]|jgi:hypothetical protein
MPKPQIIFASLLFCVQTFTYAQSVEKVRLVISSPEKIFLGQSFQVSNSKTADQVDVNIYLPDSYHSQPPSQATQKNKPAKHYPVLYVIDGGKQHDF